MNKTPTCHALSAERSQNDLISNATSLFFLIALLFPFRKLIVCKIMRRSFVTPTHDPAFHTFKSDRSSHRLMIISFRWHESVNVPMILVHLVDVPVSSTSFAVTDWRPRLPAPLQFPANQCPQFSNHRNRRCHSACAGPSPRKTAA